MADNTIKMDDYKYVHRLYHEALFTLSESHVNHAE